MKSIRNGIFAAVLLCMLLAMSPTVQASNETARNMTADVRFSATGYGSVSFLSDGDTSDYYSASSAEITLQSDTAMAGLYLMFDLEYGEYTITDHRTGAQFTAGTYGFLHEYIDLTAAFGSAPNAITLHFTNGKVRLSEITVYSAGKLPDSVQTWAAPLENSADLVLFSTHGDDEHLYFAGLLPTYAAERGYRVQVVYLTDHRNDTNKRTHEMLNGLWNVGVTAYPVFGSFADFRVDSLSGTYDRYESQYGTTKEQLLEFVVEQIRRFKPLVAVGHDLNGEYGHGMHRVYADLLTRAISITGDNAAYPESAQRYGVWEVPKLYLHLYETDPITIDYDQPLAAFDGMTAFQVSQKLGFPSHKTQQWPMFVDWIYGENRNITKAAQIQTYNPSQFGLYHTTVGSDVQHNDFFENIVTYARQEQLEQERLEQEQLEKERLEKERLEQERLEQERLEQERLEQERLEQERLEKERLEQERLAQLELQRLEQQRIEKEARQAKLLLFCIVIGVALCAFAVILLVGSPARKKTKRKNQARTARR